MRSIFATLKHCFLGYTYFILLFSSTQIIAKDSLLYMASNEDSLSQVINPFGDTFPFSLIHANDSIFKAYIQSNLTSNGIDQRIPSLYNLGKNYFNKSKYSEAELIFQEILDKGNQEKDWEIMAACHNFLSLIAAFNEQYMEVYYHNKKLYEYGNKYSPFWHALMSLNLGSFYLSVDDLEAAEKMYVKGINIFKKIPKKSEYGWLLHRLGELQRIKKEYPKARKSLLSALDFWKQTNNARGKSFSLQELGQLHVDLEQPEEAKKYYFRALSVTETENLWLSQITVLIHLGNVEGNQKNHKAAIQYLEKSADLSIEKNIPYFFKDSYQLLAKNHDAIGEIQAANKNYQDYLLELEKTVKLNQSTTKEWAKILDNYNAKEQAYELLKETELINRDKLKLQQVIIIGAFLIIALALWIAFSYFKTSQKNARQKENLEVLNHKIQEQANQLTVANKNITQQKKELQLELVKKVLVLSKHTESVKSIEVELEKMTDTKEIITIKKLLNNAKDDSLWKELDIQLNQSNSIFFEKISKKFPTLTQNDLRLCALLKINLRTKEIANLTFKNPESVKVARSRLRKKLGLTHSNTELSSFLNQL